MPVLIWLSRFIKLKLLAFFCMMGWLQMTLGNSFDGWFLIYVHSLLRFYILMDLVWIPCFINILFYCVMIVESFLNGFYVESTVLMGCKVSCKITIFCVSLLIYGSNYFDTIIKTKLFRYKNINFKIQTC